MAERESMSAVSVQCGVDAVQTHRWSRAKNHMCSVYTGLPALMFPRFGLRWTGLNTSRVFPDDPTITYEVLLASTNRLYVSGL